MISRELINANAESLIDLLVAQCTDLDALLKLARQESIAVSENNFEKVLEVTTERDVLGKKLESYHRQISDLRAVMGDSAAQVIQTTLVKESIRLALEIQTSDNATKTALTNLRSNTNVQITKLKNSTAYLTETRSGGIKCDRLA